METESTALVSVAPTNVEAFSTSPPPEAPTFSLSIIENAPPQLENQMTLYKPEPQADVPEYPDYIDAEIIELAEGDPKPPVIEIFLPGDEEISANQEESDGPEGEEPEATAETKEKKQELKRVPEEHFKERPADEKVKPDEEDEEQKRERQKQEAIKAEVERKTEEARKLAHAEFERRVKDVQHILLQKYGYEEAITLAGITSLAEEVLVEESESDAMPYVEVYTLFEGTITLMTKDGAIQLDGKLKGAGSSVKAVSYTEVFKTGAVIAELGSQKLLEEKERIFAWALAKNAFKKAMEELRKTEPGSAGADLLAKAEAASQLVDEIEHDHIASQVKQVPWKGIIDFLAVTFSHSESGVSAVSGAMDMAA